MSIASEITRLQNVRADILQAIADKGVTVPADSTFDDCPGLIASISSGSSYADLSGFETVLYTEFDSTAQLNSSFPWHSWDGAPVGSLHFKDEVTVCFYIPSGYFGSGTASDLHIASSYYGRDIGEFKIVFEENGSGGTFTMTVSLPSSKDMGGNPRTRIFRQPIPVSLIDGVVSTLSIKGNKVILNGSEFTFSDYGAYYPEAVPEYFYIPGSTSFIQGYRFYGFDCGSSLRIRPAKRLSDNAVCVIDLISGFAAYPNAGGFIIGPSSPMP